MDLRLLAIWMILCLGGTLAVDVEYSVDDDSHEEAVAERSRFRDDRRSKAGREGVVVDESPDDDDDDGDMDPLLKTRIIKRQIIKIPSGVTKVKVISPEPIPARPKRMPPLRSGLQQQQQRKRPPRRFNPKRPPVAEEELEEMSKPIRLREMEARPSQKPKMYVKEVSPEEFFSDEDEFQHFLSSGDAGEFQRKPARKHPGKKPHRHVYEEEEEAAAAPRPSRRPEPEATYEILAVDKPAEEEYLRPVKLKFSEPAATSIHMKQVPAPDLAGLNVIDAPDMVKETAAYKASREVQSAFPQHYTSHNPYVATNFGLDAKSVKSDNYGAHSVRYGQAAAAAAAGAEHQATVAAGSSGLQIVQPPQFGGLPSGAAPETRPANQRATIRDILNQDCPDYDTMGYCASSPRYPTVQISGMIAKCSDLLETMSAPAPPEPRDDLSSFSSRSDRDVDIIFDDETNETLTRDHSQKNWGSWSRSGSDSETACGSDYAVVEPGYAREVTSGRWFVIVQGSDSTLQKITTDTCYNPGKPCGGLAGMKCSRSRGFHHGIKSTRCIQRYTHHRLISWDPEAPNKCPKMRVFRFPTACVCHLRLM